ncbi:pyruvate dehydrogenase E1 alpha [Actinidia rufa]|uniref:Pyruvate dehydrogenase E1 alpha n=1 Tax=Actinidia rufa TaxID=165716 RepID=A0A7J0DX39_9ERIC|nr:pyruvate dehydrogenase E1 alpha [Actinidia rufa]
MSSAFSAINTIQPLHRTIDNPSISPFLGSTSTHKLCSFHVCNTTASASSVRRRFAVVADSDVVKQQKTKSGSSLSSLLITKEEGLELYEDMLLGRCFEDMCAQMYYRGKMFGFVHLYNGQEAVSTGFIKLLTKEDCVVSTYRDHVHALSKGVPARQVMSELFGKTTGCCRGQGGSMHMFSKEYNVLGGFAFIGEGIPVSTGAAFTSKYRREVLKEANADHDDVGLLWRWNLATSDPEIWKKGPAFGMPGVHIDGMDVLKVRKVAKEAVERARRGEGPTLIECETYRFRGHSLADPDELRDPAEKAHYATRDPITALKKYMIENKAYPKGFGIGPDGRYRCEDPKFTEGTAHV